MAARWEVVADRAPQPVPAQMHALGVIDLFEEVQYFDRKLAWLAYLCPGCQSWQIQYSNEWTYDDPADILDAMDLAEDEAEAHRAECPTLDMLAGLRLPVGGA